MNQNIKVFQTPYLLAESFCEYLANRIDESERYNIALSGGSTPKIIFEVLAKDYSKKINWNKVHFFWGDERCVSPDSNESNYKMTKVSLLDNIVIPAENIHRIRGESEPDEEAERYSNEILTNLSVKNNKPCFDFIMLGLGEDGHTASIFPDRLDLFESDKVCEAVRHPFSQQFRVTITGSIINNSCAAAFFVTGSSKSNIVEKIIYKLPESFHYPASKVKLQNEELDWYLDSQSSSELDFSK